MIKSVDKSEVLGERLVRSKALGLIPPTDLSGSVKTLLLIYNMPERVFKASTCGDNCAYWILEMWPLTRSIAPEFLSGRRRTLAARGTTA